MKLAEALSLIQKAPAHGTPFPVLLACGFSPLHLQTFLAAHLLAAFGTWQNPADVQIKTGLYGSLADTLEQIVSFNCESAAAFIEWPDLDPRLGYRSAGGWGSTPMAGVISSVEATLARLAAAIQKKPAACRLIISLPTLPLPPGFHTVGWQASAAEIALVGAVSDFARRISLTPSILISNAQKLDAASPAAERYDFRSDVNAGYPYSLKHTDALANAAANLLTLPAPKKGLISDLDDTLWRGIVGEEGPKGVAWDLAGHAQLHGLYQQMLQSLAEQGVLIGIASKNDADTAEKALGRPDLLIKRDKIFPVEAHWEAKSGSVGRILKTWNISADSVVFVDDSPLEVEEVRATHAGLECILFPKNDYAKSFALYQRLRDLFGKPALSDEDRYRLESIRDSQIFLEQVSEAGQADEFLSSLDATVAFEINPPAEDTRVLELVNKTNQFNLNGRRFTEAEWQRLVSQPGAFVAAISYQDKFGPLGKISVLCGRQEAEKVSIHTWVMSCRAFSRRIEYQTLNQIFENTGTKELQFAYTPTAKNDPTRNFLTSILGQQPAAPTATITRAAFAGNCPTLYHAVAFKSTDEQSSWTTQKSV